MPYKDPAARRAASKRSADRARAPERARREQARTESRAATLESRPYLSERDCSWAAGLFEGEGTITITPSTARYTRPVVTMTNTDPQIVAFFHERWGGLVRLRKKQQPQLADLRPYWVSKRVQIKADLLAEDLAARIQGTHDSEYHDRSLERMARMRRLNATAPQH